MNSRIAFILSLALAFALTAVAADKKKTAKPAKAAPKAAAGTPQYELSQFYPRKSTNVLPPAVRAELSAGVSTLGAEIATLKDSLKTKPELLDLVPDVQIFHNAVRYALEDEIFYSTKEFDSARKLLAAGRERAAQLRAGQHPWTTMTSNVVRGYVSKLDGSVQPYGLVVPATFKAGGEHRHRLDFWFHGRGDTLSEVNFLTGRMGEKAKSQFTPADTFVLHPYGRFMNANKFAGEVDAFEALEHVQNHYRIDKNKIAVRGFSMGGASSWHLGAHHAGLWASVNPGAGFTDVWVYQGIADKEPKPAWYEQKLWRLYDATNYAANFFNTTLVAYSGEIDAQKKAADLMEGALAAEGMKMTHIIGPGVGHKYEPKAQEHVGQLVDAATDKGRDPLAKKVRFVLFSLRFNQMKWVTVDALEQHWEKATVEAEIKPGRQIVVQTHNIAALTLDLRQFREEPHVIIDGQVILGLPSIQISRATTWLGSLAKEDGKWIATGVPFASQPRLASQPGPAPYRGLRKVHGLQGPIDDAFMDSFMFVKPTAPAMNPKAGAWALDEFTYAVAQWRRQHRGEPRVKTDSTVTDADIAAHHLILFGDPQSNKLLARVADRLPLKWTQANLVVGGKNWAADKFAPAFIFPNPLNPKRYVVVNSGFTFALVGGLSNSQQTPKLPDWAILDMAVPRGERIEKGVADANFFNERWELTAK
ncbi:MAG: prolyl oligopeptidase family serine peptidase [Verrucomicrobia bacterium]|nr:prolyl oligopeptidase family serine peptidase [Verrucomicrobiota bacterium]